MKSFKNTAHHPDGPSVPRRAGATALAVSLAIGLGAAAMPSTASALEQTWNCGLMGVNTWCKNTDNHSWLQASARWNGTPVPMCAKIINSAGSDNGTRNCQTLAEVWTIYQPTTIGPNTWAMVANGNSGTSKTISGFART